MDDRGFALVHRQQEYFKDIVIAFTDQNQLLNQYPAY